LTLRLHVAAARAGSPPQMGVFVNQKYLSEIETKVHKTHFRGPVGFFEEKNSEIKYLVTLSL
jgi:hypothetical protein